MTSDATASRSIIQAYGDRLRRRPSRRHYRLLAAVLQDLTDVPPAQRTLPSSLADHPVRPLCFSSLAAAHTDTATGRPTRRHYQHNVLWCMPPLRRVVGNTVNTRGDRRHDSRTDNHLVYSPYTGDIHSPGKRPLCSLCRQQRHARLLPVPRSVWCG